jgi:PAS domain S-box-containing protein
VASAPSEPKSVLGRVDSAGRLVSADPELLALQLEAGSEIGQPLALPQLAAIAGLAAKLGTGVTRSAVAAGADRDVELWVTATPDADGIALSLEGWTVRPAAGPRLASLLGGSSESDSPSSLKRWAADEELRLVSVSDEFADYLGMTAEEAAGKPLTRLVRLDEDEAGEMPLLSALAVRRAFTGQRARSRRDEARQMTLSGEVVSAADGSFAGFRGTAVDVEDSSVETAPGPKAAFDRVLEEVLRSPLDRIIETAERIVERADGPLRTDYAGYGTDIAAAARHLLSVITAMGEGSGKDQGPIDLAALAAEAVVMLDSRADDRGIRIDLEATESLHARGQERAVIQILVNLIGNAVRHSPANSRVIVRFVRTDGTASAIVCDEGPGIEPDDQQRIFERFERGASGPESLAGEGTGLGLAISRRLARSMGGDVTLESVPGEGARFTLTLPT